MHYWLFRSMTFSLMYRKMFVVVENTFENNLHLPQKQKKKKKKMRTTHLVDDIYMAENCPECNIQRFIPMFKKKKSFDFKIVNHN